MTKFSIFCEGLTEQLFVERLVEGLFGEKAAITKFKARGQKQSRTLTIIKAVTITDQHEYYFQVFDCGSDESAISDVRDRYSSLVREGFTGILALRDVYPRMANEIPLLLTEVKKYIPTKPVEVIYVLAVMEVEAWFLADHAHYAKIDGVLTPEYILTKTGIDVRSQDMQLFYHPANELHSIYSLAGTAYEKKFLSIARTVNALDIDSIYLEVASRYPPLQALCNALTSVFAPLGQAAVNPHS